jgi:cysteine desulfurase/selenocysteine lyase
MSAEVQATRAGQLAEERLMFDVEAVRRDFPILERTVHDKPLVYLDNAATSQKPRSVIEALDGYYRRYNSNVHRGLHRLSEEATDAYESARETVKRQLNARESAEIIFVRGTTEGINLVAHSWGRKHLKEGDEVIISGMEHHSNIVPWQLICEQTGAILRVIGIADSGELLYDEFESLLCERTRIVSVVHVSNALGTINPVKRIIERAHRVGAVVLLDGAQSAPHMQIDVQDLDCDFFAFSGHKIYGPTGIGVLYGKSSLLSEMPPYQGGGEMIRAVRFEKSTYKDPPARFEAGTPDISGAIGLEAAIDYLNGVGLDSIQEHEGRLLAYGTKKLSEIPGLRLIGTAKEKAGVLSFVIDQVHPHDLAMILDHEGVAVRAGHHCAQPVMDRFNIPATTRASLAMYNNTHDIDVLAAAIMQAQEMFQ